MSITRRDLCSILPAALIPALLPLAAAAQEDKAMPSAMFPFEKLPVRTSNGVQSRHVLKGKLATGEALEVHETTLPPGGAPHPPHHHVHFELWMASQTAEVTSRVVALPPRSGVRMPDAVTSSTACISRWAASASPRCASISAAVHKAPMGLAMPLPVMSKAAP